LSFPFVPFYPSDWLAGTRGLTAAETGVYITLVAMMYEREAPLDMPADRLARLCGCTVKAFCAARDTLLTEGKLTLRDGGLWNNRVEKECAARKNRSEKAQQSIAHRWQKTKQNQQNDDTNVIREPYVEHTNHNHNHTVDTSVSTESVFSDEKTLLRVLRFADFWNAYPHRDGKRGRKLAEAKYRAAVKRGISEQTIIDGAKRAHSDPRVKAGYARDPTTWLNQAGWDDEIAPTVTAIRGGYTPEQKQARDEAFAAMVAKARQK
jgi:uncharacterized protein YdaU (DUF1376 family)